MVKIRLQRFGKKHSPSFRVVAAEEHSKRDGKSLEILGHYTNKKDVVINKERLAYWLGHGAQMTMAVSRLSGQAGTSK